MAPVLDLSKQDPSQVQGLLQTQPSQSWERRLRQLLDQYPQAIVGECGLVCTTLNTLNPESPILLFVCYRHHTSSHTTPMAPCAPAVLLPWMPHVTNVACGMDGWRQLSPQGVFLLPSSPPFRTVQPSYLGPRWALPALPNMPALAMYAFSSRVVVVVCLFRHSRAVQSGSCHAEAFIEADTTQITI